MRTDILLASVAALTISMLTGCASATDEDADEGANAVSAGDASAWDQARAMAPSLEGAVLRVAGGMYFPANRQITRIGTAQDTTCWVERLSGYRYELELEAGTELVLGEITSAHGDPGPDAFAYDGIAGPLYTRNVDGARGASAHMQLRCLGYFRHTMPTVGNIAAAFASTNGEYKIDLALPKAKAKP